MEIRIILAEDHQITRDGLEVMIQKRKDMTMVASAGDGQTAVKLARELVPDLMIIDVTMPKLNGIEATRQIKSENPKIKVIALSMHAEKIYITEILKAGASGYLLKNCAFDELVKAILFVNTHKNIYLSPEVSRILAEDYLRGFIAESASVMQILTSREHEVLKMIVDGNSTRQIASDLHVSTKTIETHRRRVMDKLGIDNLAGLVKYAIREGITTLE